MCFPWPVSLTGADWQGSRGRAEAGVGAPESWAAPQPSTDETRGPTGPPDYAPGSLKGSKGDHQKPNNSTNQSLQYAQDLDLI